MRMSASSSTWRGRLGTRTLHQAADDVGQALIFRCLAVPPEIETHPRQVDDDADILIADLARVRFDLRRDGKAAEDESLAYIIGSLMQRPRARAQTTVPASLEVKFDTGDAAWLAGYSHALMALCDFLLAHDFHATYDAAFHRFFPRAETPLASALSQALPTDSMGQLLSDSQILADVIGFIHTINWPVVEPERMRSARQHLKSVPAASRRSWSLILTETDDARQWL